MKTMMLIVALLLTVTLQAQKSKIISIESSKDLLAFTKPVGPNSVKIFEVMKDIAKKSDAVAFRFTFTPETISLVGIKSNGQDLKEPRLTVPAPKEQDPCGPCPVICD